MMKERRKYPRAGLINIICIIKVILGEPEVEYRTHTENISEGGCKFHLEEELSKSAIVKVKLFIGSEKTMPIECKAQVAWTQKVNPEGTAPNLYAIALQFIELGDFNQALIRNLVTSYLKKKTAEKM